MDFENIIWIIIFLIYIVSMVLKSKRRAAKAKEQAAAKTTSGWKEKLTKFNSLFQKYGEFLKQMQQEMETAKQKDSKKETGWEKFLPPEKAAPAFAVDETEAVDVSVVPVPKYMEEDVAPRDVKPMRQDLLYQEMAQPLKTVPVFKPKPPTAKDFAEKKGPAVSEKEKLEKGLAYDIQDLRRAVIWSEILAPPVALREEGIFQRMDDQQ